LLNFKIMMAIKRVQNAGMEKSFIWLEI